MEDRRWHRTMAAFKRLPEILKRLRAIERTLGLRGKAGSPKVTPLDDSQDDPPDRSALETENEQ
jgi:hypothetical protein